jgi:hypothetical protein
MVVVLVGLFGNDWLARDAAKIAMGIKGSLCQLVPCESAQNQALGINRDVYVGHGVTLLLSACDVAVTRLSDRFHTNCH